MRIGSILRWAWRDFASGQMQAVLLIVAAAAVFGSLGAAEVLQVTAVNTEMMHYRDTASNVILVTANKTVDGGACDRLSELDSVQNSGGLRERSPLVLHELYGLSVAAYDVSPGFAELIAGSPITDSGVLIHDTLAEQLGLSAGSRLETPEGPIVIAGTYVWPSDGRDARLGFAVLVPTPTTSAFDECWLREWPVSEDSGALLRSTVITESQNADAAQIRQANPSNGTNADFSGEFESRISRFAWVGAAAFGLCVGLLWARRRRVELRDGLAKGQSRSALLLQVAIEAGLVAVPALVLSGAALGILSRIHSDDKQFFHELWLIAAVCPAAGSVSLILGSMLGAASLRRASMYRYFRAR